MDKGRTVLAILAVAMSTTGCASFDGIPQPVSYQTVTAFESGYYGLVKTNGRITAAQTEDEKRAIRNGAAAIYLDLADREYIEFLVSLGVDRKTANVLLEGGTVVLGSLGAIAEKGANEISAAIAALAGAKGTINREVYYEQTLPAIIGAMEANRLRIKTQIRTHLLNDDLARYPLEQAWADISEYRLSQSLDTAILKITTDAGQAAATQQQRYENAIESCGPTAEIGGYWGRLNDYVYDLADAAKNGAPAAGSEGEDQLKDLAAVATHVSATPATIIAPATTFEAATAQADGILARARGYCTKTALTTLFDEIVTKTERRIP